MLKLLSSFALRRVEIDMILVNVPTFPYKNNCTYSVKIIVLALFSQGNDLIDDCYLINVMMLLTMCLHLYTII